MHYLIDVVEWKNQYWQWACTGRRQWPNVSGVCVAKLANASGARNAMALSNRRPNVIGINGRNENLWFNIKIYFIQASALKFPHILR